MDWTRARKSVSDHPVSGRIGGRSVEVSRTVDGYRCTNPLGMWKHCLGKKRDLAKSRERITLHKMSLKATKIKESMENDEGEIVIFKFGTF